ncbi:MAG: diguanylate cyclase (GGDEF)-like protein [Flavobacteriales bacterium]|jgi:diguanylate cyclase (GGDEF)-like protein
MHGDVLSLYTTKNGRLVQGRFTYGSTLQYDTKKNHLLLVEDDPVNISVILESLDDRYTIFVAKSRKKTFAILKRENIDIALLDINLPDGNGFEICRELVDQKETYGDISVVFMTAMNSPEDEARGINLGARDYIHKPINSTVLQARVALQAQLKRQTELLSNLARIDGLTEINNRRALDDSLESEWNRAIREDSNLSLVLLDIDHFKAYNDHFGHPAGDICLKEVAACLKNTFKRGSDFVARYGGEEFAVLCANTDQTTAAMLAHRALSNLLDMKIPQANDASSEFVSFSAGVCTIKPKRTGPALSDFVKSADKYLYKAKDNGRAQICGGDVILDN